MLTRATSRFNYNLENLSGDPSQLAHPDEAAFHDAEVEQDDRVVTDLQNAIEEEDGSFSQGHQDSQSSQSSSRSAGYDDSTEEENGSFSQGQDSQSSQSSSGSAEYDDSTEDSISSEDEDGTEDGTEIGLLEDVNGGLDETETFGFGSSQESRSLDLTNDSVSVSQVTEPLFLPSSSQESQ